MTHANSTLRAAAAWLVVTTAFVVAVIGICLSLNARTARAETIDPNVCRAAIILDVSDSITDEKLEVLRNQVRRLFQPAGLYSDKIEVAFWTFSNQPAANDFNYNAPFHSYVSSKGENASFSSSLSGQRNAQGTNYQQAFGYHGSVRNPHLNDIINKTDIIAFMSDGQPNYPSEPGTMPFAGTQYTLDAGRAALLKHRAAGRTVVAGNNGTFPGYNTPWGYIPSSQSVMNYVVNGDRGNSKDIFSVSPQYSDLAAKLTEHIKAGCVKKEPPVDGSYSLTPAVSASPTVVEQSEKATYNYTVTNNRPSVDAQANYSTIGLKVNPGVSLAPVTGYASGYKDDSSGSVGAISNTLIAQLGGASKASLTAGVPAGVWRKTTIPNEAFTIPASALVGERYCRVLVIEKPTEGATPKYRYSSAVCITVGKKPKVHVYGGDLRVGRTFVDSAVDSLQSIVHSSTTTLGTKTFGSWVEYSIAAPGAISGTASASDLASGNGSSLEKDWSRLSFANELTIGHFVDPSSKSIPDVSGALRRLYNDAAAPRLHGNVSLNAGHKGLYVGSGDIRLSGYRFATPGQTVVIYAPSNAVTIAGDLIYGTQRMTSIKEIPQLIIIADRINVESGVGQVDSWLVASGTTGQVDTCADVNVPSVSLCAKQLTVNGPVMAKQLVLKRTAGAQGSDDSGRDSPAEVFNLRADAYLWAHGISGNERRVVTTYTAELPPRF